MKKIKPFLTLTLLSLLVACSPSNPGNPYDPENHTCVFDQKVTTIRYRAAGASCGHGTFYYYSCVCGAPGTETFENIESDTPPHQATLTVEGEYRTSYIIGEKFSTENMVAKLTCLNCDLDLTIQASDLIYSDAALTAADTSVEVGYEYQGSVYTTTVPIVVSIFSVDKVEIVNKTNKIYYQITGSYKDTYKANILESKIFLNGFNDYYVPGGYVTPTCTDKSNGTGEFFAEIDITGIGAVGTKTADAKKHYFPHIQVKTASGVLVNQDITFPGLVENSIKVGNDTYHLYKYWETVKKIYIPTVIRTNTDTLPSSVGYTQSQTESTFPSKFTNAVGYMPTGADLIENNGAIALRISGIHRGFTSAGQFIRSFIFYLYESYYSGSSLKTSPTIDYLGGEMAYAFGDWGFDLAAGTFYVDHNISEFGYSLMALDGVDSNDGVTAPKKGIRYYRMGGKTGETNDIKVVDSTNHLKSLTKDGIKYTLINNTKGADDFSNVWQCVGFTVTKA